MHKIGIESDCVEEYQTVTGRRRGTREENTRAAQAQASREAAGGQ